jgi:hypothetical protein
MNAWTIYWILQLDTLGIASVIGAFFLWIPTAFIYFHSQDKETERPLPSILLAAAFSFAWLLSVASAIFLPSTKTAAAMVVLPAIANNERIQHEAGDLYQLAKQALANAAAPDKAEPKK